MVVVHLAVLLRAVVVVPCRVAVLHLLRALVDVQHAVGLHMKREGGTQEEGGRYNSTQEEGLSATESGFDITSVTARGVRCSQHDIRGEQAYCHLLR